MNSFHVLGASPACLDASYQTAVEITVWAMNRTWSLSVDAFTTDSGSTSRTFLPSPGTFMSRTSSSGAARFWATKAPTLSVEVSNRSGPWPAFISVGRVSVPLRPTNFRSTLVPVALVKSSAIDLMSLPCGSSAPHEEV